MDLLRKFFAEGAPSQREIDLGFAYACQYGRLEAVQLLLERGADLRFEEGTGMPPLHWAIVGEQIDVVKLLIARHADLKAKNVYGGTAQGACEWRAGNGGDPEKCAAIAKLLSDAGQRGYGK